MRLMEEGRLGQHELCRRVGCENEITYLAKQPPLYCSDWCRATAAREMKRLVRERDKATKQLLVLSPDSREYEDARRYLALVEWHIHHNAPAMLTRAQVLGVVADSRD